MDSIWIKIASAAAIIMMLAFLYPTAKHWMQNSPKAKQGDWAGAILPLAAVIGFVILLILMVKK